MGWFLLASPFPCYYVLLIYAGVAWHQVGHFPFYGHPDPKDMGLDLIHDVVFLFCMIGGPLSLLASMGAVPLMLIAGSLRRRPLRYVGVALLIAAFHFWFINTDPLGLWEWLAD